MKEFDNLNKAFHVALLQAVRRNNLAIENLTESQFVIALKQAIECGDFQRLVHADSQNVIYLPWARVEQLETEIRRLKEEVEHLTWGYV